MKLSNFESLEEGGAVTSTPLLCPASSERVPGVNQVLCPCLARRWSGHSRTEWLNGCCNRGCSATLKLGFSQTADQEFHLSICEAEVVKVKNIKAAHQPCRPRTKERRNTNEHRYQATFRGIHKGTSRDLFSFIPLQITNLLFDLHVEFDFVNLKSDPKFFTYG